MTSAWRSLTGWDLYMIETKIIFFSENKLICSGIESRFAARKTRFGHIYVTTLSALSFRDQFGHVLWIANGILLQKSQSFWWHLFYRYDSVSERLKNTNVQQPSGLRNQSYFLVMSTMVNFVTRIFTLKTSTCQACTSAVCLKSWLKSSWHFGFLKGGNSTRRILTTDNW